MADVADVSPEEAKKLANEGAVLLDVREPEEWDAGHAPGALHVPLGTLGARVGELDKQATIVAVCRSGARSRRAAQALSGAGFRAVNLGGGMQAWEAAQQPVITDSGDPGQVI